MARKGIGLGRRPGLRILGWLGATSELPRPGQRAVANTGDLDVVAADGVVNPFTISQTGSTITSNNPPG